MHVCVQEREGKRERYGPRVMTGGVGGWPQRHMAFVKKSERDGNLQKSAGGLRGRSVRE